MFKNRVIIGIFLIAVTMSGKAYCQQSQELKMISGTIMKVDIESGVINVKTDHGMMIFYLSTESALMQSTHHISSIEINQNDPVVIEYVTSAGQNNVISLTDNK